MVYPEFIKKGNQIGVTAPSDGIIREIEQRRLEYAKEKFRKIGYIVEETENVRKSILGRSDTPQKRAQEIEALVNEEDLKVIICANGGDFLVECLPFIDWNLLQKKPKWLQGYSDFTGILYPVTTLLDIATIYGNTIKTFGMLEWHDSLKNNVEILKGNLITQQSFPLFEKESLPYVVGNEGYHLESPVQWKILNGDSSIHIVGRMIGGCIDVLNDLFGTRFDGTLQFIEKYKNDGIIWYFDNAELTCDQLIRVLWKMKENRYFQYVKGFLFGRNIEDKSYYEISYEEAIVSSLSSLGVPLLAHVDIGHVSPRMTIINGAKASVTAKNGRGAIAFTLE